MARIMSKGDQQAMHKGDVPEAFGVFKPVGHVVMAFATAEDLEAATRALTEAGFAAEHVVRYTSEEMLQQSERELQHAGPLAALGQEKNLVKKHHELAEQGHGFLVVFAPERPQTEQVAEVAERSHAVLAQKYGQMIIEELI